jgi:hypothetical protein
MSNTQTKLKKRDRERLDILVRMLHDDITDMVKVIEEGPFRQQEEEVELVLDINFFAMVATGHVHALAALGNHGGDLS